MPERNKFLSCWLPPLTIFLIALGIRLVITNELREFSPLFENPVIDAEKYDRFARALAQTGQWEGSKVFFQPPTYAYFLSLIYRFLGESYIWPRVVQSLMGALSCVMVFKIGKRLGSVRTGLISGLICALYGPLIYFELELMAPTLIFFFSQAGLLLLLSWLDRHGPVKLFFSGICFGTALISWPPTGVFIFAAIVFLFWKLLRKPLIAAQAVILILIGSLIPVLPITVHNIKHGKFVPVSENGGRNFYIGNNENWEDTMFVRPGHRWQWIFTLPYRRYGEDEVNRVGASRLFFKMSFEYIRKEPWEYLRGEMVKLYQLIYGYEIMNPTDLYFFKRYSPVLDVLIFQNKWLKFPFGLVLPFAILGIIRSFRFHNDLSLLRIFLLSGSLVIILFIVTARYRLILIPLLTVFAAFGIEELISRIKKKEKTDLPMVLATLSAIIIGLVANLDNFKKEKLFHNPVSESQSYYTLGRYQANQKRPHQALPWFEKAVQIDPAFSDAWVSLANTKCNIGDYQGCINALKRASTEAPENPLPLFNLALVYDQHPLLSQREAIRYYEESIRIAEKNFLTIFPDHAGRVKKARDRLHILTGKEPA